MRIHKARSGFTMLELSVVIVIIALITGMGTVATLGLVESAKSAATEKKLDEIEKALQVFRLKNNRLPCPASLTLAPSNVNYGLEGQPLGGCTTGTPAATQYGLNEYAVRGAVPVRSLGLPDSFMYDGWGRRFLYATDINATYADVFTVIRPREYCEIAILDNAENAISGDENYAGGAIYALVSHGPNGSGGYLESGTRMLAGSDSHEQKNCACDDSGFLPAVDAQFVSKETTSTFDDIVRYKERWQMQSEEDAKLLATAYKGPEMAISLTQNGSNNVKLFERQCGQLKAYTGTLPANYTTTVSATATVGLAFTKNNGALFTYNGNAGAAQYSNLYYIHSYPAVGPAETPSTGIESTDFGTAPAMDMSQDGYLVVGLSSAVSVPYARLWRFLNGKFVQEPDTSPAEVFGTAALGQQLADDPTKIAVSKSGNYVAFTRNIATPYTYVYYKNISGTYTRMSDPGSKPNPATAIAFSDDETMMAMGTASTARIWPITKTTNTFGSVISKTGTSTIVAMDFSPDGKYFAMVGGNPGDTLAYNSMFRIYKIDALSGGSITDITPAGTFTYGGGAFVDIAFSADSNFLVMPFIGGASDQRATIFRRTGASTFQELKGSDGTARPLTFTLNGGESPYRVKFAH
ncbi:MAG: prepilin-type N-terminal cleavage/methylation domain-containing protein [Alphaproteobacteria bacterium]